MGGVESCSCALASQPPFGSTTWVELKVLYTCTHFRIFTLLRVTLNLTVSLEHGTESEGASDV